MARKKQHYVDNEKFLVVMSEYREEYLRAKDEDIELDYNIKEQTIHKKSPINV